MTLPRMSAPNLTTTKTENSFSSRKMTRSSRVCIKSSLKVPDFAHPNLAILDINMPELSGLEVLAALQSDGFDFTSMPVIVLTNSSELSDRNKAHSFGAEYLVKAELTPREVLNIISAKLGSDQAAS
jgi:CheY-like chemotaxis protein